MTTKEFLKSTLKSFYDQIKPMLNHSNKDTLDKISESNDKLTFNGNEITGSDSGEQLQYTEQEITEILDFVFADDTETQEE